MKVAYDIVHVLPDKTEQEIHTVENPAEIDHLVETPRYMGTWITSTRKLLRYGLGEIHVRARNVPAKVSGYKVTREDDRLVCRLSITDSDEIGWVDIYEDEIVGYDVFRRNKLWTVLSFNLMAIETDDKELAFECMSIYEKFVDEYSLEGAM